MIRFIFNKVENPSINDVIVSTFTPEEMVQGVSVSYLIPHTDMSKVSIESPPCSQKAQLINKITDRMYMSIISTKICVDITSNKYLHGLVYFYHIFDHFQSFYQFITIELNSSRVSG